jgi:hypothetical protein
LEVKVTHLTPEKIDAAWAALNAIVTGGGNIGADRKDDGGHRSLNGNILYDQWMDIRAALELAKTVTEKQLNPPITVYGYCPKCGAMGKMRERRIGGDDICFNGHRYPSRTSLPNQPIGYKND